MFFGTESTWNDFTRYDFTIEDIDAIVVVPEKIEENKRWIWRARFFDVEPQVDIAMLKKGWHLAYIDVADLYGSSETIRRFNMLYHYMVEKNGLNSRPVLEGFSRGGLAVYNWAIRNPEKVSCIYADNPVCDFKSWPGGILKGPGCKDNWSKCLKAYGMNEAVAVKYKLNPVDSLQSLANSGIPLLHVYGDEDEVVPCEENTIKLAEKYRQLGGNIKLICKPGGRHHPHCLSDPAPIVEFILENS